MPVPAIVNNGQSGVSDRDGNSDHCALCLDSQTGLPEMDNTERSIFLRAGLELHCMKFNPTQDLVLGFQRDQAFLEFGCLLSGQIRGCTHLCNGEKYHFGGGPGHTWFSYCRKARGTIEYLTGQPICVVGFVVYAPLLETFLPLDHASIVSVPKGNESNESLRGEGSLTPEVNQIINQVLQKNQRLNELDRLYLISRAYELLFQLFAANRHSQEGMLPQINQGCIERASQILRENLASPPKLADIARESGLCATSLNEGFKKQFGTTVFGYIRRERLSKAKYLMTHENKSASEAAWDGGYSSLSSFHRAFYAQYGVTPGFYSKNGE